MTRIVCSNCADRWRSRVTTVQPSSQISHSWLPIAIGATALMLLIASPALSLKEDTAAVAMFPKDFETYQGFKLAESKLTPGGTGPIQLVADFGRGRLDDAGIRQRVDATRNKRAGRVEDVAAMVRFLASAEAGHVTGQVIHLNGGAYLGR